MIPLRSSEPHYTRPTATLAIIAANVAVFFYELSLGSRYLNHFIARYGIVPAGGATVRLFEQACELMETT